MRLLCMEQGPRPPTSATSRSWRRSWAYPRPPAWPYSGRTLRWEPAARWRGEVSARIWARRTALVLDFGGNAVRHGPVGPIGVHKPGIRDGRPPMKECPKCHILILADCARCPDCGFAFPGCAARDDTASGAAALSSQVKQLLCTRHKPSVTAGGPIRGRRRPLRMPAASAMPGFIIGVLWRYRSESRSA
jgi:hypothetical protein